MSNKKSRNKTKHTISKEQRSKQTTYFDKPIYYGDRLKDGFDVVNPDIW